MAPHIHHTTLTEAVFCVLKTDWCKEHSISTPQKCPTSLHLSLMKHSHSMACALQAAACQRRSLCHRTALAFCETSRMRLKRRPATTLDAGTPDQTRMESASASPQKPPKPGGWGEARSYHFPTSWRAFLSKLFPSTSSSGAFWRAWCSAWEQVQQQRRSQQVLLRAMTSWDRQAPEVLRRRGGGAEVTPVGAVPLGVVSEAFEGGSQCKMSHRRIGAVAALSFECGSL